MMRISVSCGISTGAGPSVRMSTVRSSTFFAPFTPARYGLKFEVSESARSIVNTTSSAVKGEPSWNLTLGRNLNRVVVGLTTCQDSARQGSTFRSLPRVTSGS